MTTARAIVEEFCLDHPDLASPELCYNRCKTISLALRERLSDAGIEARVLRLSGFQGSVPDLHVVEAWRIYRPFFWVHYAVEADGEVFDLTARQFDDRRDFPMICSREDVTADWLEVDRHVEERRSRMSQASRSHG